MKFILHLYETVKYIDLKIIEETSLEHIRIGEPRVN